MARKSSRIKNKISGKATKKGSKRKIPKKMYHQN